MSTENDKPWPWKFERTTERCKCGGWTEVFTGIGKGKLSDEYCVNDIRLIGGGNHMRGCPERPDNDALEATEAKLAAMPDLVVAELSGITGYFAPGGGMRYSPDGVHAAVWNATQQ